MLQFFQYLKGYVCIRLWGYSPERFMNLCSNRDIFLWNIENHGEYYTMCLSAASFKQLKPIVKKTGTRVAIMKRYGLPFLLPKIKKRRIFVAGLLGSFLFWIWMSGYIWAIDISGNYTISSDIFMDFLMTNEIQVGMKRSEVDIEALEKKIRQDFDLVTWTSARIDGTRLSIQIKENEVDGKTKTDNKETETVQNEFGSDLVAEHDGIIVSMVTRSGVPQKTLQSEVKEGEVLVSGSVPIYNEDGTIKKYRYCEADADIYISRGLSKQEQLPFVYEEKLYTGEEKDAMILELFGKEMIFSFGKIGYQKYDQLLDKKQVKLLENFYLPVYYGSQKNREYVLEQKRYSEEEVKEIFLEKLNKFMLDLEEKGVQIIEKNVTINKSDQKWLMNMSFQIVEKTGKNVPIVKIPEEGTDAAEETMTEFKE